MKKKILRMLSAVMALGVVFAAGVTASADDDELTAPQDAFYEAYGSECELHDYRDFTALTDFDVYASPFDLSAVRRVNAGEKISTNVSYVDGSGVIWGYLYSETGLGGWFRMENVSLVYDNIAFAEEHQSELTPYAGQLDGFEAKEYLYLWTYPYSGETETVCVKGDEWFTNGDTANLGERAAYVYRDPAGNDWVYLDFLPSGWVYVTNPELDLRTNSAPSVSNNTDEELGDTIFEDVQAGAAAAQADDNTAHTAGNAILPIVLSALTAAGIMGARKVNG
ncbi:MAG: hypothetical protein NC078_02840 [Ruminococcus sp.]|nr:hypothetical protein [Ruminococcus sp.]